MSTVEYVAAEETIAELGLQASSSASLRTSTAILLAVALLSAVLLNALLVATILAARKLRARLLYVFFCHLGLLDVVDLLVTVLVSLIIVAGGGEEWPAGSAACRATTMAQMFCQTYTLFSLMLLAVERAVRLASSPPRRPLFSPGRAAAFHAALAAVALALTAPLLSPAVPVRAYAFRYLCGVDNGSPLAYTGSLAVLVAGCVFVFAVCSAAILSPRRAPPHRNLPLQPADYSDFILLTRALHEEASLGKLVVTLICSFLVLEGPYICLCLVVQIRNSAEFLAGGAVPITTPQAADTLIVWLRFLFPLAAPIIILAWCPDIWPKVKEIFCCRSSDLPTIGQFTNAKGGASGGATAGSNVMTLVAAADGSLQLRVTSIDGRTQCFRPLHENAGATVLQPEYDQASPLHQLLPQPLVDAPDIPAKISAPKPSPSVLPPNYVDSEETTETVRGAPTVTQRRTRASPTSKSKSSSSGKSSSTTSSTAAFARPKPKPPPHRSRSRMPKRVAVAVPAAKKH